MAKGPLDAACQINGNICALAYTGAALNRILLLLL